MMIQLQVYSPIHLNPYVYLTQDLHMEVAYIYWLTLKVENFIHG